MDYTSFDAYYEIVVGEFAKRVADWNSVKTAILTDEGVRSALYAIYKYIGVRKFLLDIDIPPPVVWIVENFDSIWTVDVVLVSTGKHIVDCDVLIDAIRPHLSDAGDVDYIPSIMRKYANVDTGIVNVMQETVNELLQDTILHQPVIVDSVASTILLTMPTFVDDVVNVIAMKMPRERFVSNVERLLRRRKPMHHTSSLLA